MMIGRFGAYSTPTFGEVFPSDDDFETFYNDCGIPKRLLTGTEYTKYGIKEIYALLCANYFTDHIKASSTDRFKLKVMEIIFAMGATWQRRMVMQDKKMGITDAELSLGSTAIYNHANHPSTTPTTQTTEELEYIDDQNVTKYRKEKARAYEEALVGLEDKDTQRFMKAFKPLFRTFLYPGRTLYYATEDDDE